jgi:hypothetical protein
VGSRRDVPGLFTLEGDHLLSDISGNGCSVPLPVMLCRMHLKRRMGSGMSWLRLTALVFLLNLLTAHLSAATAHLHSDLRSHSHSHVTVTTLPRMVSSANQYTYRSSESVVTRPLDGITYSLPVQNVDASDASHVITPRNSSGRPIRPNGFSFDHFSSK